MDYSNNTWKVIDNYFKSTKNYLTAHHLDSYNDFVTSKIPQTLKQYNPQIHYKEYKYILINDNISTTVNSLLKIIEYNLLIDKNKTKMKNKLIKFI